MRMLIVSDSFPPFIGGSYRRVQLLIGGWETRIMRTLFVSLEMSIH